MKFAVEWIAVILVLLSYLILFLGPVYLIRSVRKRRAMQRQSLGIPAKKSHSSAFAVVFLMLMFGAMAALLIPSMLDFVAKDKQFAANTSAKAVYRCVQDYAELYDWDAPAAYIGQFNAAEDDLSAYVHKELGERNAGKWYAVVCREGAVEFALFSGHEITYADLHKPDEQAQRKLLRRPGMKYDDVIGYYAEDASP